MSTPDFNTLKKNRQRQFEDLTKKLSSNNNQPKDERYWTVTRDAAGNGSAIIRFLPAPPDNNEPYVVTYDHAFKDNSTGKWYIEKSLNTLGQADPMAELNSRLWSEGNKSQARHQGRRTKYHANILVVKDPANPENDGKVFIFSFGKKILSKITDVMQQTDELDDDAKFNPFDLWDGANFRLRVSMVEDYPNYDKSKFDAPSPVADTDEEIETIWRSEHDLRFLTDPANFKSYEDLQDRMNIVLGLDAKSSDVTTSAPRSIVDEDAETISNVSSSDSSSLSEEDEDLEKWLADLGKED